MQRHFATLEKMITTKETVEGNICRVLTFNEEQYIEPCFTGQEIGWVKTVLWEWRTRSFQYLVITPHNKKIWLTVSLADARKFDMGVPISGAPIYFCLYQKRWHKPSTLRYRIHEIWYAPEELEGYRKPEPVQAD